jgi:Ni/Co efflux regulator RcnB
MGYSIRARALFLALAFSAGFCVQPALAHKNTSGVASGGGQHYSAPKQFQAPRQTTFGARPTFTGGGNTRNFGGSTRSFGGGQSFGGNRRFGGFGSSGQRFGSARGFSGSRFSGARHFGGGGRGFGFHAPRRVAFGHRYFYNGHRFSAFRVGFYRWPHGYRYVRYSVGGYFPRQFWIQDYYIENYADFGLDVPPDDCQWVRYGSDAILFDLDTGQVDQVVYGAFDAEAGADDGDGGDGSDQ